MTTPAASCRTDNCAQRSTAANSQAAHASVVRSAKRWKPALRTEPQLHCKTAEKNEYDSAAPFALKRRPSSQRRPSVRFATFAWLECRNTASCPSRTRCGETDRRPSHNDSSHTCACCSLRSQTTRKRPHRDEKWQGSALLSPDRDHQRTASPISRSDALRSASIARARPRPLHRLHQRNHVSVLCLHRHQPLHQQRQRHHVLVVVLGHAAQVARAASA